jgi:hypothetical protein
MSALNQWTVLLLVGAPPSTSEAKHCGLSLRTKEMEGEGGSTRIWSAALITGKASCPVSPARGVE